MWFVVEDVKEDTMYQYYTTHKRPVDIPNGKNFIVLGIYDTMEQAKVVEAALDKKLGGKRCGFSIES